MWDLELGISGIRFIESRRKRSTVAQYWLDLVRYRNSAGTRLALIRQIIIHSSLEIQMAIIA
jgi:hypothetical protein